MSRIRRFPVEAADQEPPAMPRKAKASPLKPSKALRNGLGTPYRALAKSAPPAKSLAKFLEAAAGDTGKAMTEDELEQWLSKFPNLWPDDTEIDEFVSWLHQARRKGRYA